MAVDSPSSLGAYLREISKIPMIPREEEIRLGKLALKGDQKAIQGLVEANLRFVVKVANRFSGAGPSLLDLINEGNIGLLQAARALRPRAQRQIHLLRRLVDPPGDHADARRAERPDAAAAQAGGAALQDPHQDRGADEGARPRAHAQGAGRRARGQAARDRGDPARGPPPRLPRQPDHRGLRDGLHGPDGRRGRARGRPRPARELAARARSPACSGTSRRASAR